jgi:hypothetical protein
MRRPSTRRLCGFMFLLLATCAGAFVPVHVSGAAGNPQLDDLLGAWKLKYTSPDRKARECVIAISKEGTALRGNYSADRTTRAARDVGFDRGEVTFWVDGVYAGQAYTLTYKGKPRGDVLRGVVRWKYGWASGSFNFEGKRIPQRVATTR